LADNARDGGVIVSNGYVGRGMRLGLRRQRHIDVRLHHEDLNRQRKRGQPRAETAARWARTGAAILAHRFNLSCFATHANVRPSRRYGALRL
jgi:hypothetical protein